MKDLTIKTYAQWVSGINIFGNTSEPLQLLIEIANNTRKAIIVDSVCISVKILYIFSEDILKSLTKYSLAPNSIKKFILI